MRFTPVLLPTLALATISPAAAKPNILLLAIDDINDWTGCLGGHPQARPPHIGAPAKQGTLFTNAHCQSPLCNPSRASLMSGRYLDGSEELYDHRSDHHEWHNLAAKPAMAAILAQHRKLLPENEQPIAPGKSTGHNACYSSLINQLPAH